MRVKILLMCLYKQFQDFGVLRVLLAPFSLISKRTAYTPQSALNMKVPLLIIIERMALNSSLRNKLRHITVRPFQNGKIDLDFLRL